MASPAQFFESPGQFSYDGVLYTVGFTAEIMDRVCHGQFQLHQDDVLVSSYPKAGTSWVQAIVSLIYGSDNLEATNSIPLDDLVPFLEFEVPDEGPLLDIIATAKPPRIIKTHLPARFFLKQKSVVDKKTKIVYVMRNPKDTLVSYYHFYRMNEFFGCFKGSWSEFFELFKRDKIGFGFWFDIILEWWEYRDKFNILFVKYEDLHKDPQGIVRQIAKFCGKELTEQIIEDITNMTSFAQMKANPSTSLVDVEGFCGDISPFMRKGTVGDWKNYFTKEQNEYFDELYETKMKGCVLEFEFVL